MDSAALSRLAQLAIAAGCARTRDNPVGYIERRLQIEADSSVPYSTAVERSYRLFILGRAGSGKSTLLRHQAAVSGREYLRNSEHSPSPVRISARSIDNFADTHLFEAAIHHEFQKHTIGISRVELESLLQRGKLIIYLDGLDESNSPYAVARGLAEFVLRYPRLSVTAAGRPRPIDGGDTRAGQSLGSLANFLLCHLEEWDDKDINRLIDLLPAEFDHAREPFRSELFRSHLRRLASTPLLVLMLWNVFLTHGTLPANAGTLYEIAVETMLSRWEAEKHGARSCLTYEQLLSILDSLALHALTHYQFSFSKQFIEVMIERIDGEIPRADAITELTHNVIFNEISQGEFAFTHRSFVEFFASRALRYRPNEALDLLGAIYPRRWLGLHKIY